MLFGLWVIWSARYRLILTKRKARVKGKFQKMKNAAKVFASLSKGSKANDSQFSFLFMSMLLLLFFRKRSIFKLLLLSRSICLQKSAKVQPAPAVPISGSRSPPARSSHVSFDVLQDVVQVDQDAKPLAELEQDAVITREAAAEQRVESRANAILRGAELRGARAKQKADMCSLLLCFLGGGD